MFQMDVCLLAFDLLVQSSISLLGVPIQEHDDYRLQSTVNVILKHSTAGFNWCLRYWWCADSYGYTTHFKKTACWTMVVTTKIRSSTVVLGRSMTTSWIVKQEKWIAYVSSLTVEDTDWVCIWYPDEEMGSSTEKHNPGNCDSCNDSCFTTLLL